MKQAAIDAMNALFDFSEAMHQGELSINDLAEVMTEAIECGDMLAIELSMAQIALHKTGTLTLLEAVA